MSYCEFVNFISSLASIISKDKTEEEIAVLAALFTQLRRYINYNFCI